MLCPSCKNNNSEYSEYCQFCGVPLHNRMAPASRAPSVDISKTSSTELMTTTAALGKAIGGVVPLIRNIPRIAAIFVKNITPFGVAGAFTGIFPFLLFRKYLIGSYPDIWTFTIVAAAVIYFFVGGIVLWGYVGFIRGAERVISFILNEKLILESIIKMTFGTVLEYVRKDVVGNKDKKSDNFDNGDIAIPYETLRKAFERTNNGDTKHLSNNLGEDELSTMIKSGIIKIIVKFLMRGQLTKLMLLQFCQFYNTNKGITFGELGGTIMRFAISAGNIIIDDLKSKRILMSSIFIPAHIVIPFVAIYLYYSLK